MWEDRGWCSHEGDHQSCQNEVMAEKSNNYNFYLFASKFSMRCFIHQNMYVMA